MTRTLALALAAWLAAPALVPEAHAADRPHPSARAPRPSASRPPPRPQRPVARPAPRPPHHAHPRRAHRPHVRAWRPYVVRPWAGVFVYGYPPAYRYPHADHPHADHAEATEQHPRRAVDRRGSLAVGLRMGSLLGGYRGAEREGVYGDLGAGLVLRYRPVEALGLELSGVHHDQAWRPGTQRAQTLGQASLVGFITPWARLSPYFLGGVTVAGMHLDDDVRFAGGWDTVRAHGVAWGPHAGVGLEIALGRTVALDFDLRGVGYVNLPRGGDVVPLQLQSTLGLMFHF